MSPRQFGKVDSSASWTLPDLIGPPGVDVRQRAAGDNNEKET